MAVKYIPLTNKEKYETPEWGYKPHILSSTVSQATVTEAPTYDSSFKRAEEIVSSATKQIEKQESSSEPETWDKSSDADNVVNNSTDKKANFISVLTPIYEKALKERGLDTKFAKFLVAQDGLESGWNLKENKGYNIGNIITGKNWSGKSEIRGDKNAKGERITQQFRMYNNLAEYVSDKINLLSGPRYNSFTSLPTIDSFVDTLIRGGYAEDPNYKAKVISVYQSLQKGGTILESKEALNKWNKERLPLLQANAEDYLGHYVPGALVYSYLRNNINKAKVTTDSTLNVEGKYTPRTHTVTLKNPQALTHELAHASHPDLQAATIEKIIKEMDGNIAEKGVDFNEYWDHPQEIYARLVEWRDEHNINPKDRLTWEQVEQFKKNILKSVQMTTKTEDHKGNINFVTTELSPEGKVVNASPMQEGPHLIPEETVRRNVYKDDPMQIDGRYNTEFILRLHNEVAQNKNNKKKDSLLAKLGGKL